MIETQFNRTVKIKERMEIYGYTCVVDKKQEKKKRKKKGNIWMKERKNNTKNKKLQFRNATTMFS